MALWSYLNFFVFHSGLSLICTTIFRMSAQLDLLTSRLDAFTSESAQKFFHLEEICGNSPRTVILLIVYL